MLVSLNNCHDSIQNANVIQLIILTVVVVASLRVMFTLSAHGVYP
jgi:hypothetical protein